MKYPFNDFCRRLVDYPFVLVVWIFHISIRRIGGQWLAGFAFALEYLAYLVAGILCVPLVKPILHRYKVADSVFGVDIVHYGYVADTHSVKFFFQQGTDYQSVTSETGMVFDDQRSDFTFFTELHNLIEGRSVKVRA